MAHATHVCTGGHMRTKIVDGENSTKSVIYRFYGAGEKISPTKEELASFPDKFVPIIKKAITGEND